MTTSGLEEDFRGFKESFLAEAEEHLRIIEHGVLARDGESGPSPDAAAQLPEVFRSVHTIKGLAAMLEYEPIVARPRPAAGRRPIRPSLAASSRSG